MQSNFSKVVDFNAQFGVLPDTNLKINSNILEEDTKQVEFCMKLIREEMLELEIAVKEKDFVETIDALADILYVVYGASSRFGVDMDHVFDLVHKNNMSKLCSSEEEAKETVKYYEENKEKLGYDSPTYRQAPDKKHWVVYNSTTNKVLKSIKWKPVDLSYLIAN